LMKYVGRKKGKFQYLTISRRGRRFLTHKILR
jgi:hypothetical protein